MEATVPVMAQGSARNEGSFVGATWVSGRHELPERRASLSFFPLVLFPRPLTLLLSLRFQLSKSQVGSLGPYVSLRFQGPK